MSKQYYISHSIENMTKIVLVEDGVLVNSGYIYDHNMNSYIANLKKDGYVEAHYVDRAEHAVEKAKQILARAQQELKAAEESPLNISDQDAEKCGITRDIYTHAPMW